MHKRTSRVAACNELHLTRVRRIRLVLEGAAVGGAVGVVISLYRFLLANSERLMKIATAFIANHGVFVVAWFVALVLICFVVDRLMVLEPYTQASGIPQIDAEVAGRISMPWYRVVPIKLVEGVLCTFAGLSLGREGPSIQIGGMVAKGVTRVVGRFCGQRGSAHERLMITCGAAAGMSAAFHAPLTGVLFALEEIHKEFSASLVISAMTASVASDFVSSHILGIKPLVHLVVYEMAPHSIYPAIVLMGVVCGVLGCLHNKGMFFVQDKIFGPFEQRSPFVRMIAVFLLAGIVAFLWSDLNCGGDAIVERVIDTRGETAITLLLLLLGKYVFTAICFGSGAPGGTLLPLIAMGSVVGALYGSIATSVAGIPAVYDHGFVILGMAGLFAAVIQAPVTAVVMVFELTGSLEALLATTVVSIISYVTATLLNTDAFYEHLYARLLGTQISDAQTRNQKGNEVTHSYIVGVGSLLDGQCIRDVDWPCDSLVVNVRTAGMDQVAKGETRMRALSEITVVMDEGGEIDADERIRLLCKPRV